MQKTKIENINRLLLENGASVKWGFFDRHFYPFLAVKIGPLQPFDLRMSCKYIDFLLYSPESTTESWNQEKIFIILLIVVNFWQTHDFGHQYQ